jgi:hypothetical protein
MIRIVDDVVAPAVVAGVDILLDKTKPTWNQPVGIALSAAGYILGGVMGIGGNFMKNIGIASAPWAFESIYHYIAGGTHAAARASGRLAMRPAARVGSYPAQPKDTGFWPTAV